MTGGNSRGPFSGLNRSQRLQLITQLEAENTKDRADTIERLRQQFEGICRQEGVSLHEVYFGKPRAARFRVAPKYRDENGNTWTGRGRTPIWIRRSGKPAEHFRIKDDQE